MAPAARVPRLGSPASPAVCFGSGAAGCSRVTPGAGSAALPSPRARAAAWRPGQAGGARAPGRRAQGGGAGGDSARARGWARQAGRGPRAEGRGAGRAAHAQPHGRAAPRGTGSAGGAAPAPGNNECLSGRPRVTGRGGAEAAREAGVAGEGRRAGCVFARVTRPTPPAAASTQVGGDPPSPGGHGGSLSPP